MTVVVHVVVIAVVILGVAAVVVFGYSSIWTLLCLLQKLAMYEACLVRTHKHISCCIVLFIFMRKNYVLNYIIF